MTTNARSLYSIEIVKRGEFALASYVLVARCSHGETKVTYRPRCNDGVKLTPEHQAICPGIHPTQALLETYVLRLHARRYKDCACNQAYWCEYGPEEIFNRLHPCRTPEGPVSMRDWEDMQVKLGDWMFLPLKSLSYTPLHASHMRLLDPEYIASVRAPWPYHAHGPLGPSNDHAGHADCGSGQVSGNEADAPGL